MRVTRSPAPSSKGTLAGLLSNQGEKRYKLLFHKGSFKTKSIKVWYSKAQYRGLNKENGVLRAPFRVPLRLPLRVTRSPAPSSKGTLAGLLSNQGEKGINFFFIRVPLKKSIKVWYSKAQYRGLNKENGVLRAPFRVPLRLPLRVSLRFQVRVPLRVSLRVP